MINVFICIFSTFFAYAFAKRWNLEWGINDYVFLIFTDVVFSTVGIAFSALPILALLAKLTPKKVEATVFSFFSGTWCLDV